VASGRRRLIAAAAGVVLGLVGVGAVIALTDEGPDVDGEFVLDQPGVYSEPIAATPATGHTLPDVELVDASGQSVSLAEFAGTPLVVNVWYSTCAPCARELRDFAAVSAEYGDRVQFVGIDPIDNVEAMLAFAEPRGVEYPLLRDPDQRFVAEVPIVAYPTTLFVSPDGVVVRQTNAIEADQLRAAIDELILDQR
jgi:peroxiredoxin